MKRVKDVVYLLDMNEEPLKSLPKIYDLEIEKIKDGIDSISFSIDITENVIIEQQIVYRGNKYVITEITETLSRHKLFIVAESLFVELNERTIDISANGVTLKKLAEQIVGRTLWNIGEIVENNEQHFMDYKAKTPLYLFKRLARLTNLYLDFDTKNRLVHFRDKVGKNLDTIFRYRKNLKEIKRTIYAPKATVIYPIGRGGLTIENVNNDLPYIEDFTWYESLGIDTHEARKRFTKSYEWRDERFIVAGNLMREAEKVLSEMSHPQIIYETELSYLEFDVGLNDYGYIVDEELGIKVLVGVVRILEYEDKTKNIIEFNYLIEGIHDSNVEDRHGIDEGISDGQSNIILANNMNDIIIQNAYSSAIEMAFTSYAPTNAQVTATIIGEATEDAVLYGYFNIDGISVGLNIKQNVIVGWNTISISFIVPQIHEGSSYLNLNLMIDNGEFLIPRRSSQLYLIAENLLGGISAKLPKAAAIDEIIINDQPYDVIDSLLINLGEEN